MNAMDRVRQAQAEGRDVQIRVCPDCGSEQGRIRASDGSFKRWSKCRCEKFGGGGRPEVAAAPTPSADGSPPPSLSADGSQPTAVTGSGSEAEHVPVERSRLRPAAVGGVDPPAAPDLPLHRDTVQRIPKKPGE